MLCSNPYIKNEDELKTAFPCGKCEECKANKARIWKHRILLEADLYPINSFVTLTYNDNYLPSDNSVSKDEVQRYLKRLRYYLDIKDKRKLRYFAVGEYGSETFRPHYHLCLFGVGDIESINKAWQKGITHIGSIESKSAGYMTGYVTKGLTNKKSKILIKRGLKPEFMTCSKMPLNKGDKYGGLGYRRIMEIALRIKGKPGVSKLVTRELSRGKVNLPLGGYLTNILMEFADLNRDLYDAEFQEYEWEMRRRHYGKRGFKLEVVEEEKDKRRARSINRKTFPKRRKI